jgi:molybdopterin-guanine dinucleotide biosynthesis protein A
MRRLVGVILAGGAGRRMGRPKGSLPWNGATLADRAARLVEGVCGAAVVSIAPGGAHPAPRFMAVEDQEPAGRGPLAGIDAAFRAVPDADLLVVACDYPRLPAALLERLAAVERAPFDLVAARAADGSEHPLVAVWCRTASGPVGAALARGEFAVRGLTGSLRVRWLAAGEHEGGLVNWNEPGDLPPD